MAICFLALGLSSCGDDPDRALTYSERKFLDSTLAAHQNVWRPVYDSVCTMKQDSMVQYYFDSLLRYELESIKKLEQ